MTFLCMLSINQVVTICIGFYCKIFNTNCASHCTMDAALIIQYIRCSSRNCECNCTIISARTSHAIRIFSEICIRCKVCSIICCEVEWVSRRIDIDCICAASIEWANFWIVAHRSSREYICTCCRTNSICDSRRCESWWCDCRRNIYY